MTATEIKQLPTPETDDWKFAPHSCNSFDDYVVNVNFARYLEQQLQAMKMVANNLHKELKWLANECRVEIAECELPPEINEALTNYTQTLAAIEEMKK